MRNINDYNELIKGNAIQNLSEISFKYLMETIDNLGILFELNDSMLPTEKEIENLVMFFIKKFPIKPIYVYRGDNGKLQIIDGSERLLGLFLFYQSKYIKSLNNTPLRLENIFSYDNKSKNIEGIITSNYVWLDCSYKLKLSDSNKLLDITYNNLSPQTREQIDRTSIIMIEVKLIDVSNEREVIKKIKEGLR